MINNYQLPNGGWGWMIVIGVAITNVFNQSLISIFGLLFGERITSLGEGTQGAALVMNLCCVSLNLSGLMTGFVLKNFSVRKVCVFGSLLTSTGLLLCSFATQMWHIIFAYGILFGLGLGFLTPALFMAVNSYFTTNRGRAVGLALAGTGVGQMLMPQLLSYLLKEYSYSGASLVLSSLALHGLIGATLMQPVKWHMKKRRSDIYDERAVLLQPELGANKEKAQLEPINTTNNTCFNNMIQHLSKTMDLSLLKDLTFVNIIFGTSFVYTASINFSMIFPYFLQQTAQLSQADTALCMSILAACDLLSRLTLPVITDRLRISCRIIFLFGTMSVVIIRTILAASLNRTSLIIISGFYGYIRASTVVNQNLTISEYCNKRNPEKLAGALGLNMILKGVFVISLGQILGWIRDYTGSYSICLHAQNVLLIIVILTWIPEIIFKRLRERKEIVDNIMNISI